MLKKFISITLTLALIASLAPMVPVSAADETTSADTVLFESDFEALTPGKTFGGGSAVQAGSEATYLSLGSGVNAEIVTMSDADGGITNAVKISTIPATDIKWSETPGSMRITYAGFTAPTSGILVTELKVYIPAKVNSGGEEIPVDLQSIYAAPFAKGNGYFGVGKSSVKNEYTKLDGAFVYGGWTKLKYVHNLDTGTAYAYVNGEYVAKRGSLGGTSSRLQIRGKHDNLSTDEHIIFDDFKFYVPAPAAASSDLAGETEAPIRVSPVVTYDREIMDIPSASNVTVTRVSDGANIPVSDVTLAGDKKTITVDIAENLDYSASYRVSVTGLTDTGYVPASDYTFTFTTKPQPAITMADPEFYNDTLGDSSVAVTSLEDGLIRASYELTNNHATDSKDVFFFAVLRDGGKLSGIQFKQVTIPALGANTFNVAFDVDDYANQSIDIYAWDSMTTRNALMPMYSISADGITATSVE